MHNFNQPTELHVELFFNVLRHKLLRLLLQLQLYYKVIYCNFIVFQNGCEMQVVIVKLRSQQKRIPRLQKHCKMQQVNFLHDGLHKTQVNFLNERFLILICGRLLQIKTFTHSQDGVLFRVLMLMVKNDDKIQICYHYHVVKILLSFYSNKYKKVDLYLKVVVYSILAKSKLQQYVLT